MKERVFLLLAVSGLIPIALSYGFYPTYTLDLMFNIDVSSVEISHIFRAVMGLYLATATYWLIGAFKPSHRKGAITSLIIFMFGLAFGRILSIFIDGSPNAILWLYLALEFGFGLVGCHLLKNLNTSRG